MKSLENHGFIQHKIKHICLSCAFLHILAFGFGSVLISVFSIFLPVSILWVFYCVLEQALSWIFATGIRPALPDIVWVGLCQNAFSQLGMVLAGLLSGLLLWNGLKQAFGFRKRQLRRLAKGKLVKVSPDHPISIYARRLCEQYGVRYPHLWAAENTFVAAFVVPPPMRKPHLVLSAGACQLPPDILRWVIAHEVGHLVHGDARHVFAWHRFLDSVSSVQRLHLFLVHQFLKIFHWIPLIGLLLCGIVVGLEKLFQSLDRFGRKVGGAVYEVLVLWASRQSEFRADAFAAVHEGIEPGIALFNSLEATSSFESVQPPVFLRTHPCNKDRIQKLKDMND